jgi:predicted peroxiredoxin
MAQTNNLLIIVNSGADKPYNQYAAYVVAFMAKQIAKVPTVTVFYGPQGVGMAKKGELAKLAIPGSVKELIAGQLEGVSPSDLPDNLEQMARFEKDKLGVNVASCATFHVIDGFAKFVGDTTNIEDFIAPVMLPQAAEALLGADRIFYY